MYPLQYIFKDVLKLLAQKDQRQFCDAIQHFPENLNPNYYVKLSINTVHSAQYYFLLQT